MDYPYRLRHGDVWFCGPQRTGAASSLASGMRHVCDGTDALALVFDAEDGTLHKHGRAADVRDWLDKTRAKFVEGGFSELASNLTLVEFKPVKEAIAELNACIATSGRAIQFETRLQEMLAANPELGQIPTYPR